MSFNSLIFYIQEIINEIIKEIINERNIAAVQLNIFAIKCKAFNKVFGSIDFSVMNEVTILFYGLIVLKIDSLEGNVIFLELYVFMNEISEYVLKIKLTSFEYNIHKLFVLL